MTMSAIVLSGIDKRFGAVHANRDISLDIARGSIHGIVGENGAGKSTLMSILFGFHEAGCGEIAIDGQRVRIRSAREAIGHGIGMVHQHFMLIDTLSVIENIRLGAEDGFLLGRGDRPLRAKLARLARDYGLTVDPDALVGELPVGLQQRVEILKALVRDARILILDEPTAVLTRPRPTSFSACCGRSPARARRSSSSPTNCARFSMSPIASRRCDRGRWSPISRRRRPTRTNWPMRWLVARCCCVSRSSRAPQAPSCSRRETCASSMPKARRGSTTFHSRCAPARSWALPACPAMGSRNCSRRSLACVRWRAAPSRSTARRSASPCARQRVCAPAG